MCYSVTAVIFKEDCLYLPQMPLNKREISTIAPLHVLYITVFNIVEEHGNLYFPLFSRMSNRILSLVWKIQYSHTKIQKVYFNFIFNTPLNSIGFRSNFLGNTLLILIHNFPATDNPKIILRLLWTSLNIFQNHVFHEKLEKSKILANFSGKTVSMKIRVYLPKLNSTRNLRQTNSRRSNCSERSFATSSCAWLMRLLRVAPAWDTITE